MPREETPDILEEIMSISKPENSKERKLPRNKTVKKENFQGIKQENSKAVNKEKVTFNLSKELLDELDDVWFKLKKMLKDKDQRITKTLIVENSLRKCLDDFNNHLENSEIFKKIIGVCPF